MLPTIILRSFVLATACLALAAGSTSQASDLRIETRVFDPKQDPEQTKPLNESVTLFRNGNVYDFRDVAKQVTIYRGGLSGAGGRFVLLDTHRKIQTQIPADQIAATMSKLRRWAATQQDPFLRFTGAPSFEESYDQITGELRLTSKHMTYRVITTPLEHPEIKQQLRQFLDGFAQLQTLLQSGLPAEPRMRVNEALYRHGVMPLEVELTSGDDEEPSLRAEHLVAWVLSKHDRLRIDGAMDQLTSFRKVSNAEFQQTRRDLAAR